MKTAILSEDIFSHVKPKNQYGKKGDKVNILREDDYLAIVETKQGSIFPVTKNKLIINQ